jgi:signal peptidase I
MHTSVATKREKQQSTDSRNVVAAARTGGSKRSPFISRETIKSIIGAVIIFLVIRTFLVEAYHIPSGSMEPTLLVGDFLFVNKAIYGAHIPFTNTNLPGFSDPVRNSVAVYESPSQERLRPELRLPNDLTPVVVKRLVGTPGDTLYMREGLLYVNGNAQPRPEGEALKPLGWVDEPDPSFSWQKSYEIAGSRFGPPPEQPTHDNWGPLVIPPKHYFSLGDNRYNSVDARYYGPIPRANIRGKPMFIYLSIDFDDWRVRWSRIGDGIH